MVFKYLRVIICLTLLVLAVDSALAQKRNNQLEVYAGAAIPLSPDAFKDVFKVGLSINAQYVYFPSPKLGIPFFVGIEGFTVDTDAVSDNFRNQVVGTPIVDNFGNQIGTTTGATLDGEGSASTVKLGVGLRPYLTSLESSIQVFLFGSATFNFLRDKEKINDGTIIWQDFFGNTNTFALSEVGFISTEIDEKAEKFGLALGGGFEMPAGDKFNLIFQGLFNIIFTENDATTFVGATAGLVF